SGFVWGWGNLLVAIAFARAAPPGRLARAASLYRTVSFALLGLALVPFMWTEVRHAIYPQLEVGGYEVQSVRDRAARLDMQAPPASPAIVTSIQPEAAAALAPEAAPAAPEAKATLGSESFKVTANRAVAPTEVVARYAPGTLLQAGPGIPAWNYGAHPFGWSGPVESDQTVRFVVLAPVAVGVW